jgi:hypothetical protein
MQPGLGITTAITVISQPPELSAFSAAPAGFWIVGLVGSWAGEQRLRNSARRGFPRRLAPEATWAARRPTRARETPG